jgi:hypothetical protein
MTRFARTIYEGSTSGRDVILATSVAMIAEKPFWGWGPVAWQRELGVGAHNHFVYLLLEGGILGAAPYLFAGFLCLLSAWRYRKTDWGKVCLATLSTLIVSNLNMDYPSSKTMWLIIAACLSLSLPNPANDLSGTSPYPPVASRRFRQ